MPNLISNERAELTATFVNGAGLAFGRSPGMNDLALFIGPALAVLFGVAVVLIWGRHSSPEPEKLEAKKLK
jgi:hypothetical protein